LVSGQKISIAAEQTADKLLLLARITPAEQVTRCTEGLVRIAVRLLRDFAPAEG
jgi:hypothetical protein